MSEEKAITKKYALEEWAKIIEERIKSEKPVNEYCEEKGITRSAYYYYLTKLSKINAKSKAGETKSNNKIKIMETQKIVPIIPIPVNDETIYKDGTAAITIKINDITMEVQNCATQAIIEKALMAIKQIC